MTEREKFESWFNDEIGFTKESINATQEQFEGFKNVALIIWQAATKAAAPQWIPVSERLPMDGENVLIFDKFGTHGSIYTLVYYDEFMLKHKGVTHWMPLPTAPGVK